MRTAQAQQQTAHTPGAWTAQRDIQSMHAFTDGHAWNPQNPRECKWAVYGRSYRILSMADPEPIRTEAEQTANARLVAAAPDLLAALEWLAADNYGQPKAVTVPALADARAAIAKAKGE